MWMMRKLSLIHISGKLRRWFDAVQIGQHPVVFSSCDDGAAELTFPGAGYLTGSAAVRAGNGGVVAGGRIGQDTGFAHKSQKVIHKAVLIGIAF